MKVLLASALISLTSLSFQVHSQGTKTSDTHPGGAQPSAGVQCSLKYNDGNSFESREATYRKCVHDKMGPEYDSTMEQNIKEQGAYERANAAADRAKVYGDARKIFVQSQMESEGVRRH